MTSNRWGMQALRRRCLQACLILIAALCVVSPLHAQEAAPTAQDPLWTTEVDSDWIRQFEFDATGSRILLLNDMFISIDPETGRKTQLAILGNAEAGFLTHAGDSIVRLTSNGEYGDLVRHRVVTLDLATGSPRLEASDLNVTGHPKLWSNRDGSAVVIEPSRHATPDDRMLLINDTHAEGVRLDLDPSRYSGPVFVLSDGRAVFVERGVLAVFGPDGMRQASIASSYLVNAAFSTAPSGALSLDETRLVLLGVDRETFDPTLVVFDLENGRELAAYAEPDLPRVVLKSVAFREDGLRISLSDYNLDNIGPRTISVFDLRAGQEPEKVMGLTVETSHAETALSPDGARLAVLTRNDKLHMYDVAPSAPDTPTAEETPLPDLVAGLGALNTLNDIAVSDDNRFLVTADYQGDVWLWDIETGRALRSFGTYDRSLLAFGPDETLSVLGDDELFTFDIKTGAVLRSSRGVSYPPRTFDRVEGGFLVCHTSGCHYLPNEQNALSVRLGVPEDISGSLLCDTQLVLYHNEREGPATLYSVGWAGTDISGPVNQVTRLENVQITSSACSEMGLAYLGTETGEVLHLSANGDVLARTSIGTKPVRVLNLLPGEALLAASASETPRNPAQIVALSPQTLEKGATTHVPEPPAGTATYIDFVRLSDDQTRAFTVSQNSDPSPSSASNKIHIAMWDLSALRASIQQATEGQSLDPAPFLLRTGLAQGGRRPDSVAFSPDGTRLAVNFRTDTVIWSLETGQVERGLPHKPGTGPALTETGMFVPERTGLRFAGWDLSEKTMPVAGIGGFVSWGNHLISAGTTLARAAGEDTAIWHDMDSDAPGVLLPAPGTFFMNWRTLSPSGDQLLVKTRDGLLMQSTDPGVDSAQAKLWLVDEPEDGSWRFSLTQNAAFSADGTEVIVPLNEYPSDLGLVALDPATGDVVGELARGYINHGPRSLGIRVAQYGYGPEQLAVLQTDGQGFASLHPSVGGPSYGRFNLLGMSVMSGTLSADGQYLVLLGLEDQVLLWNRQTGVSQLLDAEVFPAVEPAHSVAISPDGRLVALSETNGSVSLFATETGARLAQILSFTDGGWAVVGADGRYDASDPGQMNRLSWVAEDDPLYPLPVEAFIQDYFEPRLLGRTLAGEALPDLLPPLDRNRVTPQARVAEISPTTLRDDGVPIVTVAVDIEEGLRNGIRSGLGAVKLFRDGQLVGQSEAAQLETDGTARVVFKGIALPDADEIRFSTYAFNNDGIKGRTLDMAYAPETPTSTPLKPRAYVVAVGVNAYANPAWNLSYAATDADATIELLTDTLTQSGQFEEVFDIALTSRAGDALTQTASLPMITSVLRQIAGTATQADLALPDVPILPRARPQDLVYLAFAGHGLAGSNGQFHFFTQEFGTGQTGREVPDDLTGQSLNSDLLSQLMRQIDAQDIVLVIDACNAAASVEGDGFKPGPMGSKGLGQLAYDKAMRVLVASQAEAVALESDALRHGALTYALLREGLEASQADNEPRDGQINLGEFLSFGRDRVPDIYRGLRTGNFEPLKRGAFSLDVDDEIELIDVQQPTLFDFTRSKRADVIVGRAN